MLMQFLTIQPKMSYELICTDYVTVGKIIDIYMDRDNFRII